MYVVGVNTDNYNNEKIVSNSSCTTNCLAPIAKVINDYVGIEEGFVSAIHSVTSSQNTLDGRASKNIRIGRSYNNIIPSTTGVSKLLGVVIPELNGKISGLSYRVPTTNVSIVDFSFKTKKKINYGELIEKIKYESENSMKGIIAYSYEELVSSDYIGNKNSCIIDINLGKQIGNNFFKIVAWYDNEYGYSHRVVDLLKIIIN
jgi:glyceraldehyde 3-phosphate dehydrogenase